MTKAKTFEEALEAAQWRLYVFDKIGKSHKGITLFPTPKAADRRIDELKAFLKQPNTAIDTLDGQVKSADISHIMRMPEI
ncbi:MAG: hypothetical protein WC100_01480 [Sterolibacterium sp.]